MNVFLKNRYLAVKRVVFVQNSPDSFNRGPGEPKSLRPQARRMQKYLTFRRLRHHYLTAQTYSVAAFVLWLLVCFLPASSTLLDMAAVRLCLGVMASMALIGAMFQARAMQLTAVAIKEI